MGIQVLYTWMALVVLNFSGSIAFAATNLPVLFDAPTFELTNQDNRSFKSDSLRGKVWVVDFMFTSCPHECPLMTAAMQNVQKNLKTTPDVHFVSITTDTETDKPAALKSYMVKRKIDASNWSFLTGDKKEIVRVAKSGFKLPADEKKITHSERFALVDRQGKVRGYYDSNSKDEMKKLESDIKSL